MIPNKNKAITRSILLWVLEVPGLKLAVPHLKWLDHKASESGDPGSRHREGTPVGPQLGWGGGMQEGSPSSLLRESI